MHVFAENASEGLRTMRRLPFISIRLLSAMSDTQPRLHLQALAQLIRRVQSQPFSLSAAPTTNPSTRARAHNQPSEGKPLKTCSEGQCELLFGGHSAAG